MKTLQPTPTSAENNCPTFCQRRGTTCPNAKTKEKKDLCWEPQHLLFLGLIHRRLFINECFKYNYTPGWKQIQRRWVSPKKLLTSSDGRGCLCWKLTPADVGRETEFWESCFPSGFSTTGLSRVNPFLLRTRFKYTRTNTNFNLINVSVE